jgi:hypothetical protein
MVSDGISRRCLGNEFAQKIDAREITDIFGDISKKNNGVRKLISMLAYQLSSE